MKEGDYIKIYTIGKRKFEGELQVINEDNIILKDSYNNKTYLIMNSSINDVEICKEGRKDGERETCV